MLMNTHEARLEALRKELARQQIDGFVIPISDEHMSEYVGAYAQRLGWLTGFGGSAGTAVVLKDKAALLLAGSGGNFHLEGMHAAGSGDGERHDREARDRVDGKLRPGCRGGRSGGRPLCAGGSGGERRAARSCRAAQRHQARGSKRCRCPQNRR